jgi:hypothetical protein
MAEPNIALESLPDEARVFARYLVDRVPPPELIERYADVNRRLLAAPAEGADAALLAFARRHSWSLPFLDAACALLRPGGLLRVKILVMAAVLETSREFAEDFLPRDTRPAPLILGLGALGLTGVMHTLLGIPLYAIAVRS